MRKKLPRFLNINEIMEMFRCAMYNERDLMILKCLFYLGLRNSELINLRVEDIDLINNNIKVVSGKGKKDRYVPIPNEKFKEDIKNYIKNIEGRIFKISDRHVRRIVKKYAKMAGIRNADEIHPHTLRHSYATFLQNSGVPLNVIQQVLGHEKIETTTIYIHLGIERIRSHIVKAFSSMYL